MNLGITFALSMYLVFTFVPILIQWYTVDDCKKFFCYYLNFILIKMKIEGIKELIKSEINCKS